MDLALNNLQRLICHKTNQTKPNQLLSTGRKFAVISSLIYSSLYIINSYRIILHCYFILPRYWQPLFESSVKKNSDSEHQARNIPTLQVKSYQLSPSVTEPFFFISIASLTESSWQFQNIRKTRSVWLFPVSLFSFAWVILCLHTATGSFRLTIRTGANMTSLRCTAPIPSLFCLASNKELPSGCYKNTPKITRKSFFFFS